MVQLHTPFIKDLTQKTRLKVDEVHTLIEELSGALLIADSHFYSQIRSSYIILIEECLEIGLME